MSKLPKGKKVTAELNWLDLEDMKEMCRTILEINIAVKRFQLRHTDKEEYRDMMNQSILNSKQALNKLNKIENVETINMIIMKCIGGNNWVTFIEVLGGFSGLLSDDRLYKTDQLFSREKAKKTLDGKQVKAEA